MMMKRNLWKTAFTCGLALSLGTVGLYVGNFADADAYAQGGKEGNKGDNKGGDKGNNKGGGGQGGNQGRNAGQRGGGQGRQGGSDQGRDFSRNPGQSKAGQGRSGQGAGPQNGGGIRVQSTPGGNGPRIGGRGGMHVPPVTAGPRQPANRTAQQPRVNRTPTFSQPNVRGNGPDATPGSVTFRRQTQGPNRSHFGSNDRNGGVAGTIRRGEQNSRGNVNVDVRPTMRGSDFNRSRITNRPFDGNTVNFNNRRFNVGPNSYQPSYYRHSGYHGYWNGNRGFGGDRGYSYRRGYGNDYNSGWGWGLGIGYGEHTAYGYRPFGWGLGGWGLGSIIYNSGYLGYSNPYYVSGGWSGYSYSQPVVVTYNTAAVEVDDDPNSADDVLNNAIAAFQQNDYDASLDIVNNGIKQFPDDAVLHEFRALVLFAKQDYQQAATTIHSVLAVGPGWDWTTLSSMYASVAIYTDHLRALELFSRDNPQDAAAHFLLAYHYMSCGHSDPAARQLRQVVQLMPDDRVAAELLSMVAPPEADPSPDVTIRQNTAPDQEVTSVADPIDPALLVGTWTASRDDGSTFRLTLTSDAKFVWSFAQNNQAPQEFDGKYSVEENVLALERADGGSLIAEVTPRGDSAFNFKLIGAPEDDPGLNFSK